jgi:hypothetical protein
MSAANVLDSLAWMKKMRILLYGFDPIRKIMDPALAVSIETDILTANSATGTFLDCALSPIKHSVDLGFCYWIFFYFFLLVSCS